ncbi:ras-related and estrogen-regulated growth inhibitor-like protein isoform X1 [Tribolium madens]|uniref:ras-related and estrogen-regulated growth inhibitor-like protein isoform X1 n=1 Tax=Tribolium madens TaxID=41895 RepID=UPI001CF7312E|nr:ras-related and estrogen-regulated growth inhibitor-like protein isoform X1 [Tribolium madens]
MNTKTTRRKKSSLTEVKVAVIGAPGVGKSALSVRFLTKRYIGEYDHQSETRYKHEVLVDGEPVLYEILDTCPKNEDDLPSSEITNWADGLLFVYSITNRRSFTYLKRVGSLIADSDIPVYIVGNKNDMVHLREVSAEEGAMLARDFECGFSEVTAAEQVAPVAVVFQEICRAVLAARRKSKHSLLERMLGSRTSNLRLYVRGKSDSALPKD